MGDVCKEQYLEDCEWLGFLLLANTSRPGRQHIGLEVLLPMGKFGEGGGEVFVGIRF